MPQPVRRTAAIAAVSVAAIVVAGCTATGNGATPVSGGPHLTVVAPLGSMAPLPEAPPDEPPAAFTGLSARQIEATRQAEADGAEITSAVLDRNTGTLVTNGNDMPIAIASVVKMFIADDLLLQVADGRAELSAQDRRSLDVMLRSSDDSAAEVFWNRSGGTAIIDRIVERYDLSSTSRPADGRWFNTMSTATDLVRYYDMLLSGTGGLPAEQVDLIIGDLSASTPTAPDGMVPGGVYPQRFGIPEGLPDEAVAVKQGWMCCIGADWLHLSTGVIGTDRRYVMVIGSMQAAGDDEARRTITDAVRTMFPDGRI